MIAPLAETVQKPPETIPFCTLGPEPDQAAPLGTDADVKSPASSESAGSPAPPAEGLPDEFELTPEIIEDEALRNDFMLRLAVLLIAVLLACTQIGETQTLVHVKTGQYLANHGVLPPRTDVFSHSAGETPWINLSWLFDLFSAGLFAIGGAVGLTVAKAVIAAITVLLFLKAVKREVPTWWASICAGLVLIVCAAQFTFQPQLITLLGLSLTLYLITRWQHANGPNTLWSLPVVFLVWCNMDPRAYLGLVVLMLLAVGELISLFVGRSFLADETKRPHLWLIVPVSLAAFLIHPFGWHTLLAPANLYGLEYPAWQDLMQSTGGSLSSYMPLTNPDFWQNLTLPVITALVLVATVPVTFLLNWRNVTPAHIALYVGMVGIGLANSFDLAAASVVLGILAAINAQEWYAESFRQSYSVELSERVFSVGGRAVTAIAFFGLAFLAITGRLLVSDANRLGFGFRPSLANLIQVLEDDLEEIKVPGPCLNFSFSQGDVLIWLDQKPFVDTRLSLYTQGGEESVWEEYSQLTGTWEITPQQKEETQDDFIVRINETLKARYDKLKKYNIACAVVPLGPRIPHYPRFRYLFNDFNSWRLVQLSSMAGWFYHMTDDADQNREYLQDHFLDFVGEAFQTKEKVAPTQENLASPPAWTDSVFSLRENDESDPKAQLALHQNFIMKDSMRMLNQNQRGPVDVLTVFALAHLAIRNSQEALREDPNSAMAHSVVADTCLNLGALEEQISQPAGGSVQANQSRRYFQAISAYNQAITANPEQARLHLELGNIYFRNNRFDLALREFTRFLEITGEPEGDDEAAQEQYERRLRIKKDLENQLEAIQTAVDKQLENNTPPRNLVRQVYNGGCVLMALKLLEEDGELPQGDPFTLMLQLEAGDIEQSYMGFLQLEGQVEAQIKNARVKQFELPGNSQFRHAIATAALCVGDYDKAIEQWVKQAEEGEQRMMLARLGTLPMVNRPVEPVPMFMQVQDEWPYIGWMSEAMTSGAMTTTVGTPLWNAALCQLEVGRPLEAAKLLERMLEIVPDIAYRPLAVIYIQLATEKPVDLYPPSMFPPVWEDMFAPAPGPAVAEKPNREAAKPEEKKE